MEEKSDKRIDSYRDIKVWQEAMALAELAYRLTAEFPRDETCGMVAQIRRASVSIAANIAEGHGRESTGSFIQFLRMSQGSLKELETHLLLSVRVGISSGPSAKPLMSKCDELGKMLRSLIRVLQRKKDDG